MGLLRQWALLTSILMVVEAVPQFPAGLNPALLRLQLEQAIKSDCPSVLVAKPDPSCRLPKVTECRDGDGNVVAESDATCRQKCETREGEEESVVLGSDEFCSGEAASPECRSEMEYCVRLHCKPVKVKHCIQNAPEVETKRICTPTLSLSCLKSRQRRCQLEVGALGAENRAEFNQCMRRPSSDSCDEYVSNHCVDVPVFKGTAGTCTVQIKRNCSPEDVRRCSEEFLGPKCRGACPQEISERIVPTKKTCADRCSLDQDANCKKVPNPACLRLVKERVCAQ